MTNDVAVAAKRTLAETNCPTVVTVKRYVLVFYSSDNRKQGQIKCKDRHTNKRNDVSLTLSQVSGQRVFVFLKMYSTCVQNVPHST